jgi:hypothetical protein
MLLDAIPNTTRYMVAGYAVFFIVTSLYVLSLFLRWRNLRQESEMMEDIEREAKR